jgi:hypothetical protein
MGRMSARHSLRRSAPASTVSLIDEWSMEVAEANTTDLIGLWSMDGALRDIDDCLGSPADAPAIVPAERARVCGTAYDVPILVKHPEDETWRPLGAGEDGVADESDVAERLLGY